ncbi:DUF1416 domain-containing protein [Flexivirga oryzae]|uniref:Putative GH25 family protein n=1 Tax=Flexivirga oryzae TaxID=1794944 RepID=A0A839N1P7_9MICO|nr:putative GH25 family protein [Flexivirga oryzae]
MQSCADAGSSLPDGAALPGQTVLQGSVTTDGAPVSGAYVRLLDAGDEFVAEVVTPDTGDFRFFVAPGAWTLSALHRSGKARTTLQIDQPGTVDAALSLA